ncbi:MAG TPA: hypothetical protein VJO52_01535 [Gemmatimonadaceae bacterium]|nr:hypothetical protein [Gemmatimonadaceae bacterium]
MGCGPSARSHAALRGGFDQTTNSYVYSVNERFGSTAASAAAFRVPFQIGFQGALCVRPGPYARPPACRVRRRRWPRRRRPTEHRSRYRVGFSRRGWGAGFSNPVTGIITLEDSLGLTAEQATQLQPIGAQLDAKNDSIQAQIRKKIDDAGSNADPRALLLSIRPRLTDARQAREHALDAVKNILTQAQWNGLPDQLKSTGRGVPPRQQP